MPAMQPMQLCLCWDAGSWGLGLTGAYPYNGEAKAYELSLERFELAL